MDETTAPATQRAGHPGERGLSTARAVLRVQALLAGHPDGLRADEVAAALGKSVSTAYNLLASLCEEGVATHAGGVYRLHAGFRELVETGTARAQRLEDLAEVVDELLERTRQRSYLGLMEAGRMRIALMRGHQGMPRVPGLPPEIGDDAHALALGKIALAFAPSARLQRYLDRGLPAFTRHTVTRPDVLLAQLAEIRAGGVAIDRQEFDERFWSMAVPLIDARDRLLGGLAVSLSVRNAPAERERIAVTLEDLAATALDVRSPSSATRFQACAETPRFLTRFKKRP